MKKNITYHHQYFDNNIKYRRTVLLYFTTYENILDRVLLNV